LLEGCPRPGIAGAGGSFMFSCVCGQRTKCRCLRSAGRGSPRKVP
jgi:hypothetical protein